MSDWGRGFGIRYSAGARDGYSLGVLSMVSVKSLHIRRLVFWLVGATVLCCAASAQAAVKYTLQIGRSTDDQLAVNGSTLTTFKADVSPQACTSSGWQDDSDAAWTIQPASSVRISNNRFRFQGQAPTRDYPAGDGSAQYTVSGRISATTGPGAAQRRVISGIVSFTDGSAPSVTGCSGKYKFLAIPTPGASGTVGGPGSTDFKGQFASFDLRHGTVKNLVLQANFTCGGGPDPSVDSATFTAKSYGYASLHVAHSGSFSLHTYVLDEYSQIVRLDLTGRVHGSKSEGHYKISEPKGSGLTGIAGQACSGTSAWSAARPVPPGPEATFQWAAVRAPSGAGYRYYFYIQDLSCLNGATAVELTVNHRHHRVSCSAGQGWASGPLAPGKSYATKAQAIELEHGKVVHRGISVPGQEEMPAADSAWTPVSGLQGNPPSS